MLKSCHVTVLFGVFFGVMTPKCEKHHAEDRFQQNCHWTRTRLGSLMCQTRFFHFNHLVWGHHHHQSVALTAETLNSQRCVWKIAESIVLPLNGLGYLFKTAVSQVFNLGFFLFSFVLFCFQILVRAMLRKRSFSNPFECPSRREERSMSAPGSLLM